MKQYESCIQNNNNNNNNNDKKSIKKRRRGLVWGREREGKYGEREF